MSERKITLNNAAVTLKEQLFGNCFIPKKAVSNSHRGVVCKIEAEASGGPGAASSVPRGCAIFFASRQSVFMFSDLYC